MVTKPIRRTSETMSVDEAREHLNDVLGRVAESELRVVLERDGKIIGAVVSLKDLERLRWVDERDKEAWDVLTEMQKPFNDRPADEVERDIERLVAEVKAERRARREARDIGQ